MERKVNYWLYGWFAIINLYWVNYVYSTKLIGCEVGGLVSDPGELLFCSCANLMRQRVTRIMAKTIMKPW